MCREFEGEAAYECLASSLGEGGERGESERTLKEVLIRSLGVHFISLASYRHLMSLQGVTLASYRRGICLPVLMLVVFFSGTRDCGCAVQVWSLASDNAMVLEESPTKFFLVSCCSKLRQLFF